MQAQMRPQGVGLGPFGQQARQNPRAAYMPGQAPMGARSDVSGLVDFGGRKIDRSVLGYAEQISRLFPNLRFTSGHRDAGANARANGVPNSWHLKGRAMDWSGSARDMQNAAAWARQNGAREVLIHNAGSGTHLHTAW
jgi:hypothetical protein